MRSVEASGDVEKFTAELSRVFFTHLREACTSFMELFSTSPSATLPSKNDKELLSVHDEGSDMASLSYLVGWIQEQMSVFVIALARQVRGNLTSHLTPSSLDPMTSHPHFRSNLGQQNIDLKSLNKMCKLFGLIINKSLLRRFSQCVYLLSLTLIV
jgi:hypothetical protein